jgi:hypothetical protein
MCVLVVESAWSSSHRPVFVVLLAVVVKVPAEVEDTEMYSVAVLTSSWSSFLNVCKWME